MIISYRPSPSVRQSLVSVENKDEGEVDEYIRILESQDNLSADAAY